MTTEKHEHLSHLLTTFNAAALGHGDTDAGANLLAAMACTLANLAPTDGAVVTQDGRPARLGTSLLVTGSASSGLVIDEVVAEAGRCQSNLAANLRGYLGFIAEQEGKFIGATPPTGPQPGAVGDVFAQTQSEIDPLFGTREEQWLRILDEAPSETVADLARRPKFLVSAARPDGLESQLLGLRPGRPLVHLGVGKPNDLAEFADSGAALLEGRYPLGDGCELVRANMLITDPIGAAGEAIVSPDGRGAWLGHFLWLTDGDAGPEPPAGVTTSGTTETVTARFRHALGALIARRMNMPTQQPIALGADTREAAFRWTAFLRETEPRLPGISFAARGLVDSLLFGLGRIAAVERGLTFSLAGVEAFARLLVRRAANARAEMLHSAKLAERQSQIERVYYKLSRGRTVTRVIYRDLRLPAAECRAGLLWMETAGLACRVDDDAWQLVEGAQLDFRECPVPLLEA